ncbi:MAG: hypothetical protein AAB534_03295 [Patescibacteria group bacterium]
MELNNKINETRNSTTDENYYKIVKPLRTYERDISESVREKKPSQISINLEEKKRKSEKHEENGPAKTQPQENYDHTSKNSAFKKIFVVFFLFLIVIGVIVVFPKFWSFLKVENTAEIPVVKTETWIEGDVLIKINVTNKTRQKIIVLIKEELEKVTRKESGDLIIVNLTEIIGGEEKTVTEENFLRIMAPNIPQPLLRALDKKMAFGYQIKDEANVPFLILEIDSYENAYSNMLNWESKMASDLLGFLTENQENEPNNNFQDQIIENKDTRILRKNDGSTSLIYSFLNNKTLFLSTDRDIYRNILAIMNF